MRVISSCPSGGGCKMVICWHVNKSMDDLEHHSQLVFSMSGLQGFPLKMFEHGCYATCISISMFLLRILLPVSVPSPAYWCNLGCMGSRLSSSTPVRVLQGRGMQQSSLLTFRFLPKKPNMLFHFLMVWLMCLVHDILDCISTS